MADQKINIYVRGFDEASSPMGRVAGAIENLGGQAGRAVGGVDNQTSALRRMAEVAGGIVGAALLQKIGGAIIGAAKEAFEATVAYERLEMAMESMSKRDIMRATTLTETITVGYKEIEQMGATAEEITKLTLKRDTMAARMREESERHRQLIERWGEEGLAVQTHAAKMAESQFQLDQLNAQLAKLGNTTSKVVPITETHTKSLMSAAEAEEMAKKQTKELIKWLEQLAVKSPFTEEGVQKAFKTAMAYGFVTDQAADLMVKTGQLNESQRGAMVTAQRLTEAMLDFASGTGADAYAMERISRALGQIQAKGKLSGEEVRQLMEAGLAVDSILGQAFGKTTAEIVAMREKGLIPADKAIQAIVEGLERDFAGAGEKMTQTFAGLVSTLDDIKKIAKRELFAGVFEALQPYFAKFVGWLEGIIPLMRDWGDALGAKLASALQIIDRIGEGIGIVRRVISEFFAGGISFGAFNSLYMALTGSSDGIMRFVVRMQQVEQVARDVFDGVKRVVDTIAAIPRILAEFAEGGISFGAFNSLHQALTGSADGIMRFVIQAQALETTIRGVVDRVRSAFEGGGLFAGLDQMGNELAALWPRIMQMLQPKASEWGQQVREWVAGIWANIKNWWATGGGDLVTGTLDGYGKFVSDVIRRIGEMGGKIREKIFGGTGETWGALVDWWNDGGGEIVGGTLAALGRALSQIAAALWDVGSSVATDVARYAGQLWKNLVTWWNTGGQQLTLDALAAVGQWIIAVLVALGGKLAEWGGKLAEWIGQLWKNLVTWWNTGGQQLTLDALAAIGQWIAAVLVALGGKLAEWGGKLAEWVGQLWGKLSDHVAANYQTWAVDLGNLFGKIIAGVIDFLFIKLPELIGQLVEWFKTMFGKEGDGSSFLGKLFAGLAVFIGGLAEFLVLMLSGAFRAIYENSKAVKSAVDSVTEFIEKIKAGFDWLKALPEQGIELVTGLLSGLSSQAGMTLTAVSTFLSDNLKGAVDWLSYLYDMGRDLVEGLKKGLESMVDGFKRWIRDWARRIIPEPLHQFFGIASPSLLMMEIGRNLVAGLIAGIQGGTPDLARTMAETIGSMMNALSQALSTIGRIGSYSSPRALSERIGLLIEDIRRVFAALQSMAGMGGGANALKPTIEALSQIFSGLNSMLQPLLMLAGWRLSASAGQRIMSILALVETYVPRLVTALADIGGGMSREAMANAALAAELMQVVAESFLQLSAAVSSIASVAGVRIEAAAQRLIWMVHGLVDWIDWLVTSLPESRLDNVIAKAEAIMRAVAPWGAMSAAVSSIAAVAGVRIEAAAQRLVWMVHGLVNWIDWLVTSLPESRLDEVAARAVALVQALSPWGAMAATVSAIAEVAGVRIEAAAQRLVWMVFSLVNWIDWLINYLPAGVLEAVAAKAEMIVNALSPWGAMAAAVSAIAAVAGVRIETAAQRLVWMVFSLVEWANWLIIQLPPGVLEAVAAKAEMIVNALSPWGVMAATVAAIAEVAGVRIEAAAQRLVWMVFSLVEWANWLITHLPVGVLEAVAAKAEMIVKALSPWEAMASAVSAVAEAADVSAEAVDRLVADIVYLTRALSAAMQSGSLAISDDALRLAQKIQSLVAVVQPALAAIKSLADFTRAENLAGAVTDFLADMLVVASALQQGLGAPSAEMLRLYDKAIAFAERIQGIVGFIQPGLAAIKSLAEYARVENLAGAVTDFLADMLVVASALQQGLGSPSDDLLALYDKAVAFGQRIAGIVGFVQPGLAAVKALAGYVRVEGIVNATGNFLADILLVAAALQQALGAPSDDLLALYDKAAAFGQRIQAIVGFIQPGLAAIKALAGYVRAEAITQAAYAFMLDILDVAIALRQALGSPSDDLLALYDQAAAFGQRLGGIVGFVQPGLAAVKALAGYVRAENITQAAYAFMLDILDVAIALRQALGAPSDDLLALYDQAIAFGQRIAGIVGVVQPGLAAIRDLGRYTRNLRIGVAAQAFAADLLVVANELRRALSLTVPPEVFDAATEFAGRIQALIAVVQPGVQALASLATYQRANNIVAATQGFVVDLMSAAAVLYQAFANPSDELLAALEGAAQFGDLLRGVFDFISPAIEAMTKLREYARPYGVGTGMVTLVRDIELLVTWINTTLGAVGSDTLQSAVLFSQIMEQIVTSILMTLSGLALISRIPDVYASGLAVGQSWIDGLIDGLTERLDDLVALMGYIRGLFPSSPAKHGPWQRPPDGKSVGESWGLGLTSGVMASLRPMTDAMNAVHGLMTAPASSYGRSAPSVVNTSVTVHMGGPFNVRDDQDIRRIADEVGAVFAQQSSVQRRMNYAWSGL